MTRPPPPGRPDSVAPPPQSVRLSVPVARPAQPVAPGLPAPVAQAERGATTTFGFSTALLAALIVVAGGADFALAGSGWPSSVASLALTLLTVPWAVLVLRRQATARRARSWRMFAAHLGNAALAIAFTAAKWSVIQQASRDAQALTGTYRAYVSALLLLLLFGLALRAGRVARLVALSADHPARLMAISFGVASLLGALLLALPVSLRHVEETSLLDAFFMSTSAVCVTGLATVNVAETYTFFGQLVLCVLMQVGGLGIMALTAAVTMLAGQRMGVKSSAVLAEMVDASSLADLRRTLRAIVAYTFVFEAVGAGILYARFAQLPDVALDAGSPSPLAGAGSAVWAAVFHSVSAFCNGSLSNFRGGMVPFAGDPIVCQALAALIVLGGLGFPVIHELAFRAADKLQGRRSRRMSLNTRIALVTSGVLLLAMAVAYWLLEGGASFRALGAVERVNAAVFQSACARTSGFNVVDVAAMRPATLLLTCFAMFVGADPGSTAGGIKTTTLAVLFAAYRAELRAQRPRLFDRAIPEGVVRRAVGVAFISVVVICMVTFLLAILEPIDTLWLFFETTSAFSTTGLSTGITPALGAPGKLLIAFTMLFGRIGPLTVALALSARSGATAAAIALPEERVMIG